MDTLKMNYGIYVDMDIDNSILEFEEKEGWIIYDKPECYICLCTVEESENPNEDLNQVYCNCKGTIKYVHKSCILKYLDYSNSEICSICKQNYKGIKTKQDIVSIKSLKRYRCCYNI